MEGIEEIIDELNQVDDQIAGYALDHIHSNEVILIQSPSATLRKFLLKAAAKRKFTVVCAQNSSRDPWDIHAAATHIPINHNDEGTVDIMQRSLIAAGIPVVTVPHSAVYALMSRVSKVFLDSHIVLADGAFIAAAGARVIAKAANVHRTPVIVLSGVYKLSPIHTSNPDWLIEYGVPGEVSSFDQSNAMGKIDTGNPLQDYIPADAVDLYITNLCVYLRRVLSEHRLMEITAVVTPPRTCIELSVTTIGLRMCILPILRHKVASTARLHLVDCSVFIQDTPTHGEESVM